MTDRLVRSLLLAHLALFAGCARQVAPSGGPEDLVPPRLLAASPDSGATGVSPRATLRLRFSEWVDPSTARSSVVLIPIGSRSPDIKVDGPDLLVVPREPLDSPATYVLRVQPGLADWRKAATKSVLEIPFSTGSRIDSGNAAARIWSGSDTTVPVRAKYRLGAWPLDSVHRKGLSKLLRRKDSAGWLRQDPLPWREKPWRWIWTDSFGLADLRFLPTGRWRLFAWDDKDKDNFWRPGDEPGAWIADFDGSAAAWKAEFRVRLSPLDTIEAPPPVRDSTKDSLRLKDSLALDSLDARWAALPEDSVATVHVPSDSLPAQWKGAKTRIRLWPVFKRARARVSAPSASPSLRLPPGKWAGEIWQDLDNDAKVGTGDLQRSKKPEPWCALRTFEVSMGDSLALSPDRAIRPPVADTLTPKRAEQ